MMPLVGASISPLGSARCSFAPPWDTIAPCAPFVASCITPGAVSQKPSTSPPRRVDFADQVIIVESLKKRRKGMYRTIPVPPSLLDTLDMVHGLKEIQRRASRRDLDQPL